MVTFLCFLSGGFFVLSAIECLFSSGKWQMPILYGVLSLLLAVLAAALSYYGAG